MTRKAKVPSALLYVTSRGTVTIMYGTTLLLATWALVIFLPQIRDALGTGELWWYAVLFLLLYVTTVLTLVAILIGRRLNHILRFVTTILSVVGTILGLVLVYGLLKDFIGVKCTGFFSAPTTCIENQQLVAFILFFNPYVFIPVSVFGIVGQIAGWVHLLLPRLRANRTK